MFFFLTPFYYLWSLRCRNSPKITNSGSPLQAIFLLTNWFKEPIELQDLLHIVDRRCHMVTIETVVYFKSRCPLVIMLLEGRSVALSNILDNSWMCRKSCNQGNTLLKYFVVGNIKT